MIDVEQIFRYSRYNAAKLKEYGFSEAGTKYVLRRALPDGQFDIVVEVSEKTDFRVYERDTDEEYVLVRVAGAQGGFVAEIRAECESVLKDIAEKCFDKDGFKTEQTLRVVNYVAERYGERLEFLWEDTPDCAVFRHSDTKKWFGVVMTVERGKLGLDEKGPVEIINLKDAPDKIDARVDGFRFFRAFHMNKKHWFSVCLDGRISDEELFSLIDNCYNLT